MLERISARFSRKLIKQTSAAPLRLSTGSKAVEPHDRQMPASWLSERAGEVRCCSSSELAQPRIDYSMVGYQAMDPYGDAQILEVGPSCCKLVPAQSEVLRFLCLSLPPVRNAPPVLHLPSAFASTIFVLLSGRQFGTGQAPVRCRYHFITICSRRQLPQEKLAQRAAAPDPSSRRRAQSHQSSHLFPRPCMARHAPLQQKCPGGCQLVSSIC